MIQTFLQLRHPYLRTQMFQSLTGKLVTNNYFKKIHNEITKMKKQKQKQQPNPKNEKSKGKNENDRSNLIIFSKHMYSTVHKLQQASFPYFPLCTRILNPSSSNHSHTHSIVFAILLYEEMVKSTGNRETPLNSKRNIYICAGTKQINVYKSKNNASMKPDRSVMVRAESE